MNIRLSDKDAAGIDKSAAWQMGQIPGQVCEIQPETAMAKRVLVIQTPPVTC
ncbi:hypothetical protein AURDEDRAFT_113596 [Auricularia subglabra TFB-10046 SS5]|nr:hypothetical protein AURDEDRAFT_113596 [Auricularia subglabra TFB-10046 SS5]